MSEVEVEGGLQGKEFLWLKEFWMNEIGQLIEKGEEMKEDGYQDLLKGKRLGMMFEKC